MRIFVEQLEVIFHRLSDVFADNLRILPAPLCVKVGVTDHVKGRLLAQVRLFGSLPENNGGYQRKKTQVSSGHQPSLYTGQGDSYVMAISEEARRAGVKALITLAVQFHAPAIDHEGVVINKLQQSEIHFLPYRELDGADAAAICLERLIYGTRGE